MPFVLKENAGQPLKPAWIQLGKAGRVIVKRKKNVSPRLSVVFHRVVNSRKQFGVAICCSSHSLSIRGALKIQVQYFSGKMLHGKKLQTVEH